MNGHARRAVALTTTGILLAAMMVAGGWWLGQRSEQQQAAPAVTTAAPTTPPAAATSPPASGGPTQTSAPRLGSGSWQRLPAAPLPSQSSGYAGAWTGSELLITGPHFTSAAGVPKGRSVGAAYNPATRTWRTLPPAPGPLQNMEGGYHAVWTGRELLGWGMGLDAAYNPATNRWRHLSGSVSAPSVMAWTGRQVLTWGGGCCGENSAGGAAYTPATDSWQQLPKSPLAGRHTTGAWTGKELVVVGGQADERIFADAAAYNPTTRTWRRLPPMPAPRTGATATWTGTEVLVVGGHHGGIRTGGLYADGVAYNPATNRWRQLPSMGVGRLGHTAVWTGRQLLVWGGWTVRSGKYVAPPHGLAYDPSSNRWSALPTAPLRGRAGHLAAWTGSQMLVWGGVPARETDPTRPFTDGAAYTPTGL
jgi:hypothetical protein